MFLVPLALLAQTQRDVVPLKSCAAPLYFQPSPAESREHAKPEAKPDALNDVSNDAKSLAATPAGSLVFVAMTPCRIADTRDGTFPAGFGPPSLVGNATRTFAIQSQTSRCLVPQIAQAYSFNITVVPPGTTFPGNVNPSGALGYLTIWPTGLPQPVVSTLNSFLGTVVANAAIVPAGTGGSVDVFVSHTTDLIIDINGYYAAQTGVTLAQGSASAPSLSFAADPGTGIFSNGPGILNIGTGGTSRMGFGNGIVSMSGLLNVDGGSNQTVAQFINSTTETTIALRNTNTGGREWKLDSSGGSTPYCQGCFTILDTTVGPRLTLDTFNNVQTGNAGYGGNFIASSPIGWRDSFVLFRGGNQVGSIGTDTTGTKLQIFTGPASDDSHARMTIDSSGNVGIGINNPGGSRLQVEGGLYVNGSSNGVSSVWGNGEDSFGVEGTSSTGFGVYGSSGASIGVYGHSYQNYGVYGNSNSSYAGYFDGNVHVNGCVSATNLSCPSDARLKRDITPLSYGLPEVLRLRPVTWQWKDATKTEPTMGLIAQDVEPVLPELILQNADNKGALGLNYMGLIPVLIKGMQEQQAQIVERQEQNRKLEERLAALEKLLSTMQANTAAQ
jgi:hypothetical protein